MSAENVYSLEEIAEHKEKGSCWLVIHEGVYDVTKFMEEVSAPICGRLRSHI